MGAFRSDDFFGVSRCFLQKKHLDEKFFKKVLTFPLFGDTIYHVSRSLVSDFLASGIGRGATANSAAKKA